MKGIRLSLCAVIAALALVGCGSKPSVTFEIDGDNITITYTLFGQEYEWSQSFSMSGDTITIGGTEFTKD